MNNEEKHQVVKEIVSEEVKRRLYLYSYIALIVLSIAQILFASISLIVDGPRANNGASMAASYVALAFAGISLVLLAVLSALYFVSPEDVSPKRIHAVSLLRVLIRLSGLFTAVSLLTSSYLGLAEGNPGWASFVRGWAIAMSVVEGLMSLYELWKNAWIKENPERYLSPVYPVAKTSASTPDKKEAPKEVLGRKEDSVIEVEASHPEPQALPFAKKAKKKKK